MNNLEILKNIMKDMDISIDAINEDTKLMDMGLDSLDIVQILMNLEEKLNIQFSTDELANAKTIKDILSLIESKVK